MAKTTMSPLAKTAVESVFQKYAKETGRSYFRKGLGEIFRRLDDISAICVYDVTRLFRPLNGSFLGNLIIQKLIEHDVKVLSVKEGLLDFSKQPDRRHSHDDFEYADECYSVQ